MKYLSFLSVLMLIMAACTPKEEEQEPDYENMVMKEDEEWSATDRKTIAGDLPDPQEQILLEAPEQSSSDALR